MKDKRSSGGLEASYDSSRSLAVRSCEFNNTAQRTCERDGVCAAKATSFPASATNSVMDSTARRDVCRRPLQCIDVVKCIDHLEALRRNTDSLADDRWRQTIARRRTQSWCQSVTSRTHTSAATVHTCLRRVLGCVSLYSYERSLKKHSPNN